MKPWIEETLCSFVIAFLITCAVIIFVGPILKYALHEPTEIVRP